MFTGIIQAVGAVAGQTGRRLTLDAGGLDLSDVGRGDSVAVNGCCLTVVELSGGGFAADVSEETLARTTLGGLREGAPVNLEKAMRVSDRFGGHMVSGHVDGVGSLRESAPRGNGLDLLFEAPAGLARYIAAKGSICVDGVSLTVNRVRDAVFSVAVIPHTLKETVIGGYRPGAAVNLEVDRIARHLERLLECARAPEAADRGDAP